MIARVFAVLAASSVFLAAIAAPAPGGNDVSQCKSGYYGACCKSVREPKSLEPPIRTSLEKVGVDVKSLTGLVAWECSTFGSGGW
ncbi:hypothetical protein H1R20_g10927, partial [Candolleomyces eurysporus]